MSTESWITWIAKHDVYDLDLRSDAAAQKFLRRVVEVGRDPKELLRPLDDKVGDFVDALSWATREALWQFAPPLQLSKYVVHLFPDILQAACELGARGAVFGFWDVFLIPWELRQTWTFRPNVDKSFPIIEEVKEALIRQMGISNEGCLQRSALHGINHLKDEVTANRARAFESSFTEETKHYSISALAFRAL